jgi:hypothetical protein
MFIQDPGSWIWVISIPDLGSGSRGQNSSGSRIWIRKIASSDVLIILALLFCLIILLIYCVDHGENVLYLE